MLISNTIGVLITICAGLCIAQSSWADKPTSTTKRHWLPLAKDELHDPKMTSLKLLKSPEDALSKLPGDSAGSGNQVDWGQAIELGLIKPRGNIHPNTKIKILNLDILRENTGEMDMVLFPHKQHTEWMDCNTCHEKLFKSKRGATKFSMFDILNGQYCGLCHGAVAFPLTQCQRCHSVPRPPMTISK